MRLRAPLEIHAMQRRTLTMFAAGILLLFLASPGRAQSYPARPVTIVVPFTTGSGIDVLARTLGHKLNERWNNVGVVVDNRTGTSGHIVAKQGFSPAGGTPEALTNQFKTELARWLRIAEEAKITVD